MTKRMFNFKVDEELDQLNATLLVEYDEDCEVEALADEVVLGDNAAGIDMSILRKGAELYAKAKGRPIFVSRPEHDDDPWAQTRLFIYFGPVGEVKKKLKKMIDELEKETNPEVHLNGCQRASVAFLNKYHPECRMPNATKTKRMKKLASCIVDDWKGPARRYKAC